ncbi:oligosaccharide flippase family protein [Jatrophihabitans telluris]|uniref:Oligosaccharide flippase family protein n=1 Tax=Jatrophihabitans telluris TaxID=2038343 RepID=A0ABY4QWX7_9ACTN|nr:oligosaccharide flippase family protein [Jatrophihabitans telluris]UQX87868.1 oligosaccharide flippase family protein [Jatrophihabitans telluris]
MNSTEMNRGPGTPGSVHLAETAETAVLPVLPDGAEAVLPDGADHVPPSGLSASDKPNADSSSLFGRGLLYVVVWSLQTVVATIISPVLAYVLGPTEFGHLASSIALYQVLIALGVLGLDQAVSLHRVRADEDGPARGLVATGMVIAFGFTLLVGLTSPLWAAGLGFGHVNSLLIATILWTAPGGTIQIMLALLLAEDRLRPFTFISALSAVGSQLCGVVLIIVFGHTASVYAWGGVISLFATLPLGIIATRPLLRGIFAWHVTRAALKLGLPIALSGLATFVLNAGDRIIVQRDLGAAETGRYQVAYTVGSTVVLLLGFVGRSWTPRFAAIADETVRRRLLGRSRDQIYRLLVPMILGLTLAAPIALRLVAPASFRPGTLLLVVFLVAVAAFPVTAGGATGRALISVGRTRPLATATVTAAVVNVVLNIIFVPSVGIEGSAAATVIAFAVQALLQRAAIGRSPWPRTEPLLWASMFVAIAVSAASVALPQTPLWNVIRLVVALLCFPWFLVRLRSARNSDQVVSGRHAAPSRRFLTRRA